MPTGRLFSLTESVGVIYTVGHSTRTFDDFASLLAGHGVEVVADVRRYPMSRRHPHFAREALEASLGREGIGYRWLGESLGGRRKSTLPVEASPNRGWTEPAFRCYADAIGAPDFEA